MQRKRGAFPHRSITRKVSRGQSPLSSPLLCVTHEFTAIFDARNAQDIQGQSFRETSQPMFTLLTNHSRGELSNERVAQRLSRHFIIDCDKISPLATARRGKTWQTISSDSRVNVRACLPACLRAYVRACTSPRVDLAEWKLSFFESNLHSSDNTCYSLYLSKRIKILSNRCYNLIWNRDKFIDMQE